MLRTIIAPSGIDLVITFGKAYVGKPIEISTYI